MLRRGPYRPSRRQACRVWPQPGLSPVPLAWARGFDLAWHYIGHAFGPL